MKTKEEILRENATQWLFLNADSYELECIYRAMKEYALSLAKEALRNAAGNFPGASDFANDTRESILSETNIPKEVKS